jgi:hypothetical protein
MFYHQVPPILYPHQAIGGIKKLNFFYISIEKAEDLIGPGFKEAIDMGISLPQAQKSLL